MNISTRALAAWMACFTILLAAFAPSVSYVLAVGQGNGASWVEICTPKGLARIWQADDAPQPTGMHAGLCPFCMPHAGSNALPAIAAFELPIVGGTHPVATSVFQATRPFFFWTIPPSRAPPASS